MKTQIKDIINIEELIKVVKEAGKEILKIYNTDFEVKYKDDKSPLTQADLKSNEIIRTYLETKYNIPILSEEEKEVKYEERKNWKLFWELDPLDGTKEFVKKNGEFTICLALIENNKPIFGVIYSPVLGWLYYNDDKNSYKITNNKIIKLNGKSKNNKLIFSTSRSRLNEETKQFINTFKTDKEKEIISMGSALKIVMLAEGTADINIRINSRTMEWDTAAAEAIVNKTGKILEVLSSNNVKNLSFEDKGKFKKLFYNRKNLENPGNIIVW